MDAKIHPTPNPYQTPISSSIDAIKQKSGVTFLAAVIGILLGCTLILGYVMVAEVPCLKKVCYDKNIDLPTGVAVGVVVVSFLCENFILLLALALVTLLVIESSTSGQTKRKIRRTIGIVTVITTILFTAWVTWATLSAMDWTSLYLS